MSRSNTDLFGPAMQAMTQRPGDPDFMASLARGLAVLRAFDAQQPIATTSQISAKTGLSRAVVRRCLYTLEHLGYVLASAKGFHLAPKTLSLGDAYLHSTPWIGLAQPVLEQVSQELAESSSLAILESDQVLYLARAATQRIMSVSLHVGSRLPAYCTSMGQVLLAYLPADALSAYLKRVTLKAYTPHTITQRAQLLRCLERVRRERHALIDQQLEIGLRSLAVPVSDAKGTVIAAINASAPASAVSLERMQETFLPLLERAAWRIGALLAR